MKHKKTIALSIPTGIGAETGGYAGDGGKIARMFSKYFNVITHPNVLNGGILSAINDNILYVEGYAFDEFFKGNLGLFPLKEFEQNKIGVIFDKNIPDDILNIHINTIFAMREVKGLDIPYFEVTGENVGVEFFTKNEISTGIIKNEGTLLNSAKNLLNKGCTALAIVCYFGDDTDSAEYENGTGIDPIGGVEAVISHYITKELLVPCAHAPAFSSVDILKTLSNPKVAAENISSTYLPSVLEGLSRAPLLKKGSFGISNKDVFALIVPKYAFGGIAPLAALEAGIRVVSVNNKTKTNISCTDIGYSGIINYNSYEECLLALAGDINVR